ncbi:MAG: tyrosine-type recombinase/integrase [Lachnospiraceae bacterium]|nr:tyrosine-type recombinase/integrase [Lachnospiraceae bacterium]
MEEKRIITVQLIDAYIAWLREKGRARNTLDKYRRDLGKLYQWLEGRSLTPMLAAEWRDDLQACYAATSVNSMLAAANVFFEWMGWPELKLSFLKIQRKTFCDKNKELDKADYEKLIAEAKKQGNERLCLLLETGCGLGLRVSEIRFITLEAAAAGKAEISMKGKIRTIIIPRKLSRKLRDYAKKHDIKSGEIFITRSGRSLSRSQIWREMKKLSESAGVDSAKVFPHNLRHLFARTYYKQHGDIVKLADILGHSSIETTRIYLISTGEEHARQLEMLGLVS